MKTSETQVAPDIAQARQQLEELARRHCTGELSKEAYEEAKSQIERNILTQVLVDPARVAATWRRSERGGWLALAALALGLVVGALGWDAYRTNRASNDFTGASKSYRLPGAGASAGVADPHAGILRKVNQLPPALAPKGMTSSDVGSGVGTVSGTVVLAPALLKEVKPDDTIFVFARPAQGSRMPLAMLRKQVRDLPIQFVLDDSTAMSTETRLSQAGQVIVAARMTKSANAVPLKGDLIGRADPVPVGSKGLTIQISEIVNE